MHYPLDIDWSALARRYDGVLRLPERPSDRVAVYITHRNWTMCIDGAVSARRLRVLRAYAPYLQRTEFHMSVRPHTWWRVALGSITLSRVAIDDAFDDVAVVRSDDAALARAIFAEGEAGYRGRHDDTATSIRQMLREHRWLWAHIEPPLELFDTGVLVDQPRTWQLAFADDSQCRTTTDAIVVVDLLCALLERLEAVGVAAPDNALTGPPSASLTEGYRPS